MVRLVAAVLCAAVVAVCSSACAAPKVAVVYSAWSGSSFRDEFDEPLKQLGWTSEKFENRDVAKLSERLSGFDIVLLAGVANYENTQDLAPWKDDWLAFLRRGGSLVVTDASYGSVLDQWVGRLGRAYALTSTSCAPHTGAHGGSTAVVCDPSAALLHVPDDLAGALEAKAGIWAHIETWGPGWTNLITCADGKSVLVARQEGSGCVVVTSYFSFRGEGGQIAITRLLENLWSRAQAVRSGVEVTAFDAGAARPGTRDVVVGLRAAGPNAGTFTVVVTKAEGSGAPQAVGSRTVEIKPDSPVTIRLPMELAAGEARVALTITPAGGEPLTMERRVRVPESVRMAVSERHLYPHQRVAHVSFVLAPPMGTSDDVVSVEVRLDGKPKARVAGAAAASGVDLNVGSLCVGRHQVTARLLDGTREIGTASTDVFRHPLADTYVRPDGTLMVRGKEFFPFGWYHVSWPFDAADRMAFLRDIAAGGFNTVHAGVRQIDEWQPFLDEAAKLGVKVITEFGVDPMTVISRYKRHEAVLAWNPGDEPDGGGVSQDVMRTRHDAFKAEDPNHPTYLTLCVPSTYARYAGAADIIAPDPYPLPGNPTSLVYKCLSAANKEARRHQHALIAVLQCFYYPGSGWSREPTPDEVRNMTYLALLSGAKGIVYYTYADNQFRVTDHAALWTAMKRLPAEMAAMKSYVLDGRLTILETGKPDVFAGMWEWRGRTVVCVANTSSKESREVLLALPGKGARGVRPLFADRPAPLGVRGARITGTLAPLETDLYVVAR